MFDELRGIIERDYNVFSGKALEGYFKSKFIEGRMYSRIGGWWDRKGENEIDLVGENEFDNIIDFYEVKRDDSRINLENLAAKALRFLEMNPSLAARQQAFKGLSLRDM